MSARKAQGDGRCGIAWRLGEEVPCPVGGCALLVALGEEPRAAAQPACPAVSFAERSGIDPETLGNLLSALGYDPAGEDELCPVEAIAARVDFNPAVVRTLDELRRELDRSGAVLATARAARTRAGRHAAALDRWRLLP